MSDDRYDCPVCGYTNGKHEAECSEKGRDAAPTAPQQRVIGRPFPPGVSGNPKGRPAGSRNKLCNDFLLALQEDFEQEGMEAIQNMRIADPAAYCKIIASLLPRDVQISTRPFTDFTDEDLRAAVDTIRFALATGAGAGGVIPPIEGEATRVLPAIPEAAGVPRGGGIFPREAADGGEPARQDDGSSGRAGDAPDGPLPF